MMNSEKRNTKKIKMIEKVLKKGINELIKRNEIINNSSKTKNIKCCLIV